MDTYLAIASKRDERRYADARIPEDVVTRILDAGRVAGSAANRQQRRFVIVEDPDARRRLGGSVYEPTNVQGATLIVALFGKSGFDVGRSAQNMMLAAWNEGVVSCPNGIRDADAAAAVLGEAPAYVLSFGYPARPHEPESRPAEEWSARANRKPLAELVETL